MAVDDHGLEVLKKSAEEVTPGDRSDYLIKTRITNFSDITPFIDGIEGLLTTIRDNADEIEGFTDNIEPLITATNALLTTIRDNADQLEGYTDGLEGLVSSTNSLLTTIRDNADQIEGFTDGLEGLITSANALLTTIRDNADGVESLLSGISGFVDGLEALIAATNATLSSVDAGIPAALGQTTKANSMPVVLPSDQTFPVFLAPAAGTPDIRHGQVTTNAVADVVKTTYTEQSSEAQRSIVSSSASDASAGVGARTVKIIYYNNTMAGPFTETITLNGTTAVNTVATNIRFIEKMEVVTVGSSGFAVGTISLKAATGGGGATIWTIAIGDLQTFAAHHYIATGKTMNLQAMTMIAGASSGATYYYVIRQPTVANQAVLRGTQMRVANSDTNHRLFINPIPIVGPARFVVQVTPDANGVTWYSDIEYSDV